MKIRARWRSAAVLVVVLALTSMVSTAVSAPPSTLALVAKPTGLVGQLDRQAAIDGYLDTLIPALDTPVTWNGSTSPCNPGTPQPADQQATLVAINYMRSLVGVAPVTLSPELSAQALEAATMMLAQKALSHYPTPDFACYTAVGAATAGKSNLYLGVTGAEAISGYMVDPGDNNKRAGHRRWIIDPRVQVMGSGSTSGSNALNVLGAERAPADTVDAPTWLPWPSAGYFPAPLEPGGRWSLSTTDSLVNFSTATVSMVGPAGPVSLTVNPESQGYGSNSVVWDTADKVPVSNADARYSVTVSNLTRDGVAMAPVTYDVVLARPTLTQITAPTLSGVALPGQALTVSVGTWRPTPDYVEVDWKRNGKSRWVDDEASYPVRKEDVGTVISAEVTVVRYGLEEVTVTLPSVTVAPPPVLRATKRPRLRGKGRVGSKLKVRAAKFAPTPAKVNYAWFRDGRRIKGSTGRTYKVKPRDRGHKIKARLTARRPGYESVRVTTKVVRVRRAR